MKVILVLCIGNICRSPLAQALLAQQLPAHTVWSAGLEALVGQAADPFSVQVASAHGLDISAHRAQQVTGFLCQQSDVILVMEQSHKGQLERRFPLMRGKVFRLGQYSQSDIADPYGRSLDAFEIAYAAIADGVGKWVPRIRQFSAGASDSVVSANQAH